MTPDIANLLNLAAEVGKGLYDIVSAAITAKQEELAALNSRLADTLAAMRGERTKTHADTAAREAALRAELEAMKTKGESK